MSDASGKRLSNHFPHIGLDRRIHCIGLRGSVCGVIIQQTDEAAAREEARRSVSSGSVSYAKEDVVVKLGGWDPEYTRAVAQGCLVALKQLTLADKKLAGMYAFTR